VKGDVVDRILQQHPEDHVLIIGGYLDQLRTLAERLDAPIITGQVPSAEREVLYDAFRRGEIRVLVVSKVANFAVDLPDANVAIQVSGAFGSRQEEAQRLGRILRPKESVARFYSLVTSNSCEQEFALKRQLFLTEQGYGYGVLDMKGIADLNRFLAPGLEPDPTAWVGT
jgi:DNA excision repair protein ERCC-3